MKGNDSIFLRRSFFPRYALGMHSNNNSVMYKFIGGIFNQLYYIDLFKVTSKMLWLVQPEQPS